MLLEGLYLPLTTPFHPDGRLNLRKLEHNVDRYSRTPAAGMLVLASSGELSSLADAEASDVLAAAIALAAKHKVMLAGIGRDSTALTLTLAHRASSLQYDAIAIAAPCLALTPLETLTYFQTIADRSPLPVVLLSEPGRELTTDLIATLAPHPNILGLIDSGRDSGKDSEASTLRIANVLAATATVTRQVTVTHVFAPVTARMLAAESISTIVSAESLSGGTATAVAPSRPALRTRTRRVGFQVLTSSTSAMFDAFAAGAVGAAPRLAAALPQACYEVFQAWKDSDLPLAAEKQERLQAMATLVEQSRGIAVTRYACDRNGYFGGHPRLPLLPLNGEERLLIDRLMSNLNN